VHKRKTLDYPHAVARLGAATAVLLLVLPACFWSGDDPAVTSPSAAAAGDLSIEPVDVGGYELFLQCIGEGSPVVVLEAGLNASGTSTWFDFQERFRALTRTCTYDRAGLGFSDRRPRALGSPDGSLMAEELHALLEASGEPPPYVLVGHSFGGMVVRLFAAAYPEDVVGVVLEDSSQEEEIDAYREVNAGAWIDGGTRIDIEATERALREAGQLGDRPLVVVTAGIYEDVLDPRFAFEVQQRLPELSTTVVHVVAKGSGHFVHDENPQLIAQAIGEVVEAVRSDGGLPPCEDTFPELGGRCLLG
jgi:pimeloyl-ACP methyl ester carboxylesterase